MDARELQSRAERGEDLHTEFKAWKPRLDAIATAVVAFSNTDGGTLLLGVADDGGIEGVPDPDEAVRYVEEAVRTQCHPTPTVVQEVVPIGDRRVVVVQVPKGDERPYRSGRGIYHVRTSGGHRQASRQELLRLFQASKSLHFDELPAHGASIEDLDESKLLRYLEVLDAPRTMDLDLLRNLHLLSGQVPTVAGVLAFGRSPDLRVAGGYVAAARVAGLRPSDDVVDAKRITGDLSSLIDGAAAFLRAHLRSSHVVAGFEPEGRPEVPEAALREAITNAVAHRDWSIDEPVRIFVFDDRVEIWSPGPLPNAVTIEAVRRGAAHVLRNPTVFAILLRLGRVTDLGRGVLRILDLVRDHVGAEVEIREDEGRFVISIPRPPPIR